MRICALFSCSPRGLSSWASSLQSALTAASGVGYNLKNSHSTGLAALPRQQLNHGSEREEGWKHNIQALSRQTEVCHRLRGEGMKCVTLLVKKRGGAEICLIGSNERGKRINCVIPQATKKLYM